MNPLRDPFDPDNPPPHWVDEDGNFVGWMSEAEVGATEAQSDTPFDEMDDGTISLADLFATNDADDDDLIEF